MEINIVKATVVLSSGGDHCMLFTDLPPAFPLSSDQGAILRLDVGYDKGADYIREHFKIEPEVIPRPVRA